MSCRGMLRRPQPTDSEVDLLREQQQFLTSGAPAAANVVRRPDKRRGEGGGGGAGECNGENKEQQRDVVTIEGKSKSPNSTPSNCLLVIDVKIVRFLVDLPDELPSLTPAPPKKSRFKAGRVTFEDEDAGERLDSHDTHISAVLSRIVVRVFFCRIRLEKKKIQQNFLVMGSNNQFPCMFFFFFL